MAVMVFVTHSMGWIRDRAGPHMVIIHRETAEL